MNHAAEQWTGKGVRTPLLPGDVAQGLRGTQSCRHGWIWRRKTWRTACRLAVGEGDNETRVMKGHMEAAKVMGEG